MTAATTATTTRSATAPPRTLDLVHWILTDRTRFREAVMDDAMQRAVLPRVLGIAVAALALYGAIMWGVVVATGARLPFLPAGAPAQPFPLAIPIAYAVGLIGAVGICLPSFYFYALQCGFRPSLRNIVISTTAGQALTGIFLLGILPVYAAGILAAERLGDTPQALQTWAILGLLLPLPAGLVGVTELRDWFVALAATLPREIRGRRRGFIELLALWSAGLYAVVAPVVVYQLLVTLAPVRIHLW